MDPVCRCLGSLVPVWMFRGIIVPQHLRAQNYVTVAQYLQANEQG